MGTLICTIELDKLKGATVTIENPDAPGGKITQTVTMDGTTLTLKVAGAKATSTYVQDQEKIHITVKELLFDAETITAKSSKQSVWESQDTLRIESKQAMSLKSSATLTAEATGDAKLSGANVTASAKSSATLEGLNTALKGSASLKGEGAQLALKASGPANLEGAMVSVKASGMLTAESSGVATLKGSITNVQGSLVKLG